MHTPQTTHFLNPDAPLKIVFFDLDGTLVRRDHTISEASLAAIGRLRRSGVAVCIATGRALFGAREIAEQLNINSQSLFFSGALLINPSDGTVLSSETIAPDAAGAIAKKLKEHGIFCEMYTLDSYFIESPSPLADIHRHYLGRLSEIAPFNTLSGSRPIYKIGTITTTPEEEQRLKQIAREFPGFNLATAKGAAHPGIVFGNITSGAAGRDKAFDRLLEHFAVKPENIAAFGDAESDIPFIKRAGIGVAMGDAPEEVRRHANFVTKSAEEDGVAFALGMLRCGE